MSKRKFVKPLLIGSACAVPLGLIVGLSVNWDHRQFISSVGSSGVKPFMEAFSKEFSKQNPKVDVQVESGGTTFAIEQLANGLTKIGNASNNPYYSINNGGFMDKWTTKKTITLGFEGVVIMYKLPEKLSDGAKKVFDIVINKDNISHLYGVFSGYAEDKNGAWTEQQAKDRSCMWHYMTAAAQAAIEALPTATADKAICQNTTITPFVRTGGNSAANSSIAFTYYSKLMDFTDLSQNQQNAFRTGNYGKYCGDHPETEESNARAWELFNKEGKGGAMTYLTTGFVKNKANQEEIIKHGYQLAGYLPKNQSTPVYISKEGDLDKICVKDTGYNWFRPINIMMDINDELTKQFITWIFTDFEKTTSFFQTVIRNNGAKPVTKAQWLTMYDADGGLFGSKATDIELALIRSGGNQEVFGAIEFPDEEELC